MKTNARVQHILISILNAGNKGNKSALELILGQTPYHMGI
jgi:hypothetical protein